jgi:hypothetical protein
MNSNEVEVIKNLRDKGYAVVIFCEEELRGANAGHVEDRLVELGWDVIDSMATEEGEE